MIEITQSKQNFYKLFFASPQFWVCNIAGWTLFAVVQSIRDSFGGNLITTNIISCLPTLFLGMFASVWVNYFYKKMQWHTQHPIQLVPLASLIAFLFALINILINSFELVISIPEICSRQHPRPPFSCGIVTDLFVQSLNVMLVWCLFYFLIQAERKSSHILKYSYVDIFKAAISLLIINHIGNVLTVVAYVDWGNTYYLFSKNYFIESLSGTFFCVIFSAYILFVKPGQHLFGSRILPLTPTICALSLGCAILSLGAGSAFLRLYNVEIRTDLPFSDYVHYVLFGSTYGNFNNPGVFAGILEGGFTTNLLAVLFFLCYRYSIDWEQKEILPFGKINVRETFIFWIYNIIFWCFFGGLIYATDLMDLTSLGESVPFTNAVSFAGFGFFVGALLCSKIKYFSEKKTTSAALGLKIFVASLLMGTLLTSTVWLFSYAYIFVILEGYQIKNYADNVIYLNYVFASTLVSCILCGLWSFICYMIESQHIHKNATIHQLQIEKNMKEVQLNALAGKLDPHFVFNALNNIRALVREDSEKARSAIVVLSDILRSPIAHNLQNKIPVKEEMTLVRNYISLSKIQYEELLHYEENMDHNAENALIPAMMLQILVENAIKHGISQLPDGGTLSLQISKSSQQLHCKITNHGSLNFNSKTSGFGIGITAIQQRLILLYNNNAAFNLREENDMVIAELTLPFETSL
jgi:two-component system LytT family sensor kinase